MIKFVLNFILFGCIYFLLWRFFPSAFDFLLDWVNQGYEFVATWVEQLIDKSQQANSYTDSF